MSDQLFPEMYTPGSWASVTNEVYPQIAQAVAAESRAVANNSRRAIERGYGAPRLSWPRADQLIRRAGSSNTTQFTSHAILCGDSADTFGTSMDDIFNDIITTSRNVSHMCTSNRS